MPYAPPSTWRPAALAQPAVPYPLPPFIRPPMTGGGGPAPAMTSWTMPWSQLPGTMGFPGDMAEYNRKFQQSYSTPEAARDYGNVAAQRMFEEKRRWDSLPAKVKAARRATGGGAYLNSGGAGGYGGGYGGPFQQAMDQANQANEARYRDVLGGFQNRYERGLGMLAGLGQQEARDINELYDTQFARNQNDLIGRGLGNSTVMSTMRMGTDRERAADLGRLNERMRQQVTSADSNLSRDALNFMERKTEKGPDMQLLAQLAKGVGAAGFGMPSGYGGGGGYRGGGPNLGTAWATTGGFPAGAIMGGSMAGFGSVPSFGGGFGLPSGGTPRSTLPYSTLKDLRDARLGYGAYRAPSNVPNWGPYYQGLAAQQAMQAQAQRGVDGYRN